MGVHFGYSAASEAKFAEWPEKDRLERQVRIFEGLAEKLIVTGTTMETYRQGWWPDKDCPEQQCHEPVVHLAGGWSPQMFAISYVNRVLIEDTRGSAFQAEPAAVSRPEKGVKKSAGKKKASKK